MRTNMSERCPVSQSNKNIGRLRDPENKRKERHERSSLELLLVYPLKPHVAHALRDLKLTEGQDQSVSWIRTRTNVQRLGTTSPTPSGPSCTPSHSQDRTRVLAGHLHRPASLPHESNSTDSVDQHPLQNQEEKKNRAPTTAIF